jgi:hypothetical protein
MEVDATDYALAWDFFQYWAHRAGPVALRQRPPAVGRPETGEGGTLSRIVWG